MPSIEIRDAVIEDSSIILKFVTDLAIYEKAEHEVKTTLADIKSSLFSNNSTAHALICTIGKKPIGFAVYFYSYSTWLGKNGIFLEDLYVDSEYRGSGAGKALLKHLAVMAMNKNCGRVEWNVLDWNEPAINFYNSIGAKPQNQWIGYRLTGQSLVDFANG